MRLTPLREILDEEFQRPIIPCIVCAHQRIVKDDREAFAGRLKPFRDCKAKGEAELIDRRRGNRATK